MSARRETPPDPVEELSDVLGQTMAANALRLTTSRGGYVGGGQPHATLDSDRGAIEAVARGLLARKVAEPSRAPAGEGALDVSLAKLPPGPYTVSWPDHQGGLFSLWGKQGTPPDFADGWAIPLVASGVDTAITALADLLNALAADPVAEGPGLDARIIEAIETEWYNGNIDQGAYDRLMVVAERPTLGLDDR